MPTAVIGLFKNHDTARAVVNELVQNGCSEDDIDILAAEGDDALDEEGIAQDLIDRGFDLDRAHEYGKAVHKGVALVAAEAGEDIADQALQVMRKYDVLRPEDVLSGTGGASESAKAQSIEEDIEIGKVEVEGGKRLRSEISEQPVEETVRLKEETVEVEERPADRPLSGDEATAAFRDETIDISATSEKPVISKQARVTGEVVATKESGEHEETVKDTVRRKDVKVEDMAADKKKK